MKLKKMIAACMTAAMAVSAFTGTTVLAAEEPEEILFAFHMGNTTDLTPIEDALNEILIPKINVKVDLEGYSWSSYNNQISLMQAGGDKIDVFGMCPDFSTFLANNQLLPLDELLEEYAPETKELIGENFLKACTSGGVLYGLPNYGVKTDVNGLVIRKDLAEEVGFDLTQINEAANFEEYVENMDMLTELFTKIYEAHPELVLVPSSQNPASFRVTEVPFVDKLGDGIGVLMQDDSETVVNLYETEEFKTLAEYLYKWNQSGFILEDATTTQENADNFMKNGRSFAHFEPGGAEDLMSAAKTVGIWISSV